MERLHKSHLQLIHPFLDAGLPVFRKCSIKPVRQGGVCFQKAEAEAGEQFHGSSAA